MNDAIGFIISITHAAMDPRPDLQSLMFILSACTAKLRNPLMSAGVCKIKLSWSTTFAALKPFAICIWHTEWSSAKKNAEGYNGKENLGITLLRIDWRQPLADVISLVHDIRRVLN